nr:formin-like protein 5 [Tanacetum cinerariifolium]
ITVSSESLLNELRIVEDMKGNVVTRVSSESLLNELRIVEDMKGNVVTRESSFFREEELEDDASKDMAIKEELQSVERRTEEEHDEHNATKMAAMETEELEHGALDASIALAKIQIKGELDTLDRTKDEEVKKFKSQKIHFDFSILIRIKELMVDVSSKCMEVALKCSYITRRITVSSESLLNELRIVEDMKGNVVTRDMQFHMKIKGELDTLDRTKDEEVKKFKSQKIHFDFSILIRIKELMVDVSSKCMEVALKGKIYVQDQQSQSSGILLL